MSKSFLPMMITCFSAIGVYYLGARLLPDIPAAALGILTAVLLSWLFSRHRYRQ